MELETEENEFASFGRVMGDRFVPKGDKMERDLADELFNRTKVKEKEIEESFLKAKAKVRYSSVLLEPALPRDQEILDRLLNSPEYSIMKWSENWDKTGTFKLFILYSEQVSIDNKGKTTHE